LGKGIRLRIGASWIIQELPLRAQGLEPIPFTVAGLSFRIKVKYCYACKDKRRKLRAEPIQAGVRKEFVNKQEVKLRDVGPEMEVTPLAEFIYTYGVGSPYPALKIANTSP
jgi:hypothetical protein